MEGFLTFIGVVGSIVLILALVVGLSIWVMKASDPCRHSYERIDTCNDKKMILVCRRCGKIKRLKK